MATATATIQESVNFRCRNGEMFSERTRLVAQIDELSAASPLDIDGRRRLRILRRELDNVMSQIIDCNMGLVRSYTSRFASVSSAQSRRDFEAAGVLGLVHAVSTYDPESGPFGQWAFHSIRREVLRAVRDADHQSLSFGDFEKRPAIIGAARRLRSDDRSYSPSAVEVAGLAGVPVAQAERVLAPRALVSIDRRRDDGTSDSIADLLESTDRTPEAEVVSNAMLRALHTYGLSELNARELFIVVRRYGLDDEASATLEELGSALGVSRERIRQIEAKALAKLQHPLVVTKLGGDDVGLSAG